MTQQPDNKPGFYYVSIISGDKTLLAVGPFVDNHGLALAMVEPVRAKVAKMGDPHEPWFAYGTCRTDEDAGPGKLNAAMGFSAPYI